MVTGGAASRARKIVFCAGAALAVITAAGAASAQAYYPDYPPAPPPRAYAPAYDYPPQPYADPRYSDTRAADPRYTVPPQAARQDDAQGDDPRYDDPRAMSPEQLRAYRRWVRYYSQAPQQPYPARPGDAPQTAAPLPPMPPPPQAVAAAASVAPPAETPGARTVAAAEAAVPAAHLPHRLVEAAEAYAEYVKKTCAINAAFKSGASVAEAVKTGSGYEMHQFEEGAIAYAALTALQEPAFVAGARQLLREGDRGGDFADRLAAEPMAALNIQGADLAAARASSALRKHGERMVSNGAQVKQAAYTVQHSEWSKAQVSDPDGRLAAAKATSSHRLELKGDEAPELTRAVLSETAGDAQAPASPVIARALALAALAALGQLKGDDDAHLAALLVEPRSADCLKMAKLNLFQCLSVARPHYEDIFCLGEHGMMDTGQCVVKAAGYTPIPVTIARAATTTAAGTK